VSGWAERRHAPRLQARRRESPNLVNISDISSILPGAEGALYRVGVFTGVTNWASVAWSARPA